MGVTTTTPPPLRVRALSNRSCLPQLMQSEVKLSSSNGLLPSGGAVMPLLAQHSISWPLPTVRPTAAPEASVIARVRWTIAISSDLIVGRLW
jgi:hypothetical protein